MKQIKTVVLLLGSIVILTFTGCVATWTPGYVAVSAPVPVVEVQPAMVVGPVEFIPETYVWDGFEYVGVVGGEYVYLGPTGVWFRCEPWRLGRFHGWERGHGDWHSHAVRNEHYRGHSGPQGHGPQGGHGGRR